MKRGLHIVLSVLVLLLIFAPTATADVGPKPSVCISFTGLPDEPCYGTLLSARASTGPDYAYGTYGEENQARRPDQPGWETFVNYQDSDGYYYLQKSWEIHDTKELNWTYYPPNPFKILLYFPESDTFISSDILERYAFDSYYTVNVNGDALAVRKSYNYTWELISLAARILITIALEMVIALLFGYRSKEQLIFIAKVNVVTQVVLNVALNIANYREGAFAFVAFYILFELAVLFIESAVYTKRLIKKPSVDNRKNGPGRAFLYALVANVFSFVVGLEIAKLIPGIF